MRRCLWVTVVLFVVSVISVPASFAGAIPTLRWSSWFGAQSDDAGAVAVTPDGSTVVTTGSTATALGSDVMTSAFEAISGRRLWQAPFDGPAHGDDVGRSIAVTPDGGTIIVLAGIAGSDTKRDIAVVAYQASDGTLLWSTRLDGRAHKDDFPGSLALSPDGGTAFVVATFRNGPHHGPDLGVVALETSTGTASWRAGFNGPVSSRQRKPYDTGEVITVDPDGTRVYVSGSSSFHVAERGVTFVTIGLDAGTGARLWKNRGPIYQCGGYWPQAMTIVPDGSTVVATGYAGDGCNAFFEGFLTMGYDASSGDQTWMEYSTDYSNIGPGSVAIEATSDGTEIVQTGMQISLDYDTSPDYGTIAYRPDGSTSWWHDYDGVTTDMPYADDEATDLTIIPGSNDVIVIGSSKRYSVDDGGTYTGGPWDGLTVAYSETGALLWTSLFLDPASGGDVYPEAIAAAPDGSAIYVAGSGETATGGWNAFVVSYAI